MTTIEQTLPEIDTGAADADSVRTECERIRIANGGRLRAEDMELAARNKSSVLHPMFTWDNDIAGYKWRLTEARQIIRVFIHKGLPQDTDSEDGGRNRPQRIYISPPEERSTGGGYLTYESISESPERRKQIARQAIADIRRICNSSQYAGFDELQPLLREVGIVADKWWWKLELG